MSYYPEEARELFRNIEDGICGPSDIEDFVVAAVNEAIEQAAVTAENWGNAPPNPHGRRAALAKAIREGKR